MQSIPTPSNTLIVRDNYREATIVRFVSLTAGEQTVAEEVVVVDPFDSDVERVAWQFTSRGLALVDTNFRLIAPP